jgi:hypothetical protein
MLTTRSEARMLLQALLIGSLLMSGCSPMNTSPPMEGRIVVSITPGKPGAPTETVTVSWREGDASLRSERRSAGGEVLAAGEAGLDERRIRELWQAVERNHLTAFTPRKSAGQVFDFGVRRVQLEWASRAGEARHAHDFSWTTPLENEADVAPLLRATAGAARARVPGVQLAYFPPASPDRR